MRALLSTIMFVVVLNLVGTSQTILLFQNVERDSGYSDFGPNRSIYESMTYGMEGIVGPSAADCVQVDHARSFGVYFGNQVKTKITSWYNLGYESVFTYRMYTIAQNPDKIFATPQQHQTERLNIMQYSLNFFQRFNFTKRGDHLGAYLDMGAYGYWTFWRRHVTVDEVIVDGFTQSRRTVRRGLDYVNPLGYGVYARLGFNWFSIKGEYRMVSLFKDIPELGYTDLPPFAVSICFGFPSN